jgi:homoserine kinase type II
MLQVRWAIQADYFAGRLAANDLTGINDGSENEVGLEDAHRGLLDVLGDG